MKRHSVFAMAVAAVLALAIVSPVGADDEWQFALTPYLWFAGLSGDLTVGSLEADITKDFGDILGDLELAFMGHFEAGKGSWAILFDGLYVGQGIAKGNLNSDVDQTILEGAVAYGISGPFQVLGGFRYNNLSSTVERIIDPTLTVSSDQDWVDPIIGVRIASPVGEDWNLSLRADIGGFGAGSDFAFNFAGVVEWRMKENLALGFGYRVLSVDYDDEDGAVPFIFNATTHGPGVGLTFIF